MKREDMQKLILLINFLALIIIAVGIVKMSSTGTKTYLVYALVVGVILLVASITLAAKWKKPAKEQQTI